jgi:ATP-dependent HslUV protease ATP-binding subunit HslU
MRGVGRALGTVSPQPPHYRTHPYRCRRLHTVLERILSDISFGAPEHVEQAKRSGNQASCAYVVDEAMVGAVMGPILKAKDLSKYVL